MSDHGKMMSDPRIHKLCENLNIIQNFNKPNCAPSWITRRCYEMMEDMGRRMTYHKNLPSKFWKNALLTACHIMNRATLRPHTTATPYEVWFGKKPNLNYLRTFGTSCHIPKGTQGSSKKKQGILIGYAPYSPNYHVLDIATYEVIETWSYC